MHKTEKRWGYLGNLTESQEMCLGEFMEHYVKTFADNQATPQDGDEEEKEIKTKIEIETETKTEMETKIEKVGDKRYDYNLDPYLYPSMEQRKVSSMEAGKQAKFFSDADSDTMQKVMCLRFLRARKFDLTKAKKLLDDCLCMREKFGYHKIYESNGLKVMSHPGAQVYAAFSGLSDKQGRPIAVGRINVLDGPVMQQEPHITGMFAFMELMSLRVNPEHDGLNYILDVKTPRKKPQPQDPLSVLKEALHRTNIVFPEVASSMIIINASFSFRMLWKVAGLWLSKRTHSKIKVLSSNYKAELFKIIPEECVFPVFGGTAEGPATEQELDEFIKNQTVLAASKPVEDVIAMED